MSFSGRKRHRQSNGVLFVVVILAFSAARGCGKPDSGTSTQQRRSPVSTPVQNPIEDVLRPVAPAQLREGIVAAILVDTSGSMKGTVLDADGVQQPKIAIAQRAALNLVNQFDTYAREHADQTIFLGIYEFSERGKGPSSRTVINLGPPDVAAARSAIQKIRASGDTPIGDAMIKAKRDLDATGLSKRHILVITDGENTTGYSPVDVTRVISAQTENARASIYFVAFDVAAEKFNSVRDSGGLILAASNETDLKGTLDYLLTGKILAEQPEPR